MQHDNLIHIYIVKGLCGFKYWSSSELISERISWHLRTLFGLLPNQPESPFILFVLLSPFAFAFDLPRLVNLLILWHIPLYFYSYQKRCYEIFKSPAHALGVRPRAG